MKSDVSRGSFEGDALRGDQEVDMVGHDDVGVQGEVLAIVVEGGDEKQGVGFDLEETASVVGRRCDEEGAGLRGRCSCVVHSRDIMLAATY